MDMDESLAQTSETYDQYLGEMQACINIPITFIICSAWREEIEN